MANTTKKTPTQYADVASWELSDSLWERIEPLLPTPLSASSQRLDNKHRVGGDLPYSVPRSESYATDGYHLDVAVAPAQCHRRIGSLEVNRTFVTPFVGI